MKSEDFCASDPLPCQKNLGIKRIDMPQINTQTDLRKLRAIAKNQLPSIFQSIRVKSLDVSKLKHQIFASQKEINTSRATDIALKTKMIHSNKNKNTNTKNTNTKNTKKNKTRKTKTNTKSQPQPVPVILLYSSKTKEYLVVDGHHRWLAYYLYSTKTQRMKSLVLEISTLSLEDAFHKLNKALMKDKHIFHKRHTFKNT